MTHHINYSTRASVSHITFISSLKCVAFLNRGLGKSVQTRCVRPPSAGLYGFVRILSVHLAVSGCIA